MRATLSMNKNNTACGQFINHTFNSAFKVDDNIIGCSEDGLFILNSGSDDAGENIQAHFITPITALNDPTVKRLRSLHCAYESDSAIECTITLDESDSFSGTLPSTSNSQQAARLNGRDDKRGSNLSLKIANTSGGRFAIDYVEVFLISRMRGVK